MKLNYLTDSALLKETKLLAQEERNISARLLHYLKEIEARKLYCDVGCSSLFDYLVKELKYTEAAASRRIQAARLLKEIPAIEQKIVTGELNLTTVAMAAQLFKNEKISDVQDKKNILKELEGKTKRETEKILLPYGTTPQVKEKLKVVNEDFVSSTMLLKQATLDRLAELRGYFPKLSNDGLLAYAIGAALSALKKQKYALTDKPRKPTESKTRRISASVRRSVLMRDKVCHKCGANTGLEFDHIQPWALGGKSTAENLRLLCRACNQRQRITQYNRSSYKT